MCKYQKEIGFGAGLEFLKKGPTLVGCRHSQSSLGRRDLPTFCLTLPSHPDCSSSHLLGRPTCTQVKSAMWSQKKQNLKNILAMFCDSAKSCKQVRDVVFLAVTFFWLLFSDYGYLELRLVKAKPPSRVNHIPCAHVPDCFLNQHQPFGSTSFLRLGGFLSWFPNSKAACCELAVAMMNT